MNGKALKDPGHLPTEYAILIRTREKVTINDYLFIYLQRNSIIFPLWFAKARKQKRVTHIDVDTTGGSIIYFHHGL
jgi:hypothetical protein